MKKILKVFEVAEIECDNNSYFDTMIVVAETESEAFKMFIEEMNSIADYYEYSWLGEATECYPTYEKCGVYIV